MHENNVARPSRPEPGVLVVDDEELGRAVLRAGLRNHGFDVWDAGSGREALELYFVLTELTGAPPLVLLDVQMPGLDGPTVLSALQSMDPDVRAFFVTGHAGNYSEDELLARGACRVFEKPVALDVLAAALRQCLERGSEPRRLLAPASAATNPGEL